MPIHIENGKVRLDHPKGSSAEVLLYGATVISWKTIVDGSEPTEHLFLSKKAVLDGSRAVRGGIPLVFPCFGPPSRPEHSKMVQHGFARTETWKLAKQSDDGETLEVHLTLDPNPSIESVYDKPFSLTYVVAITEKTMVNELRVTNPHPSDTLEFQTLLHTYFRAPMEDVRVEPLQGKPYFDKTTMTERVENRELVDVKTFTDSVYGNAEKKSKFTWPGGGIEIESFNYPDLVVWNPQEEVASKMTDMEEYGWHHFLCVEPASVRDFVKVTPGGTWSGKQIVYTIPGRSH
ncbi:galactose mutarotase-like protein [Coniophora puteana RWD-64-598 SS2]|uniref:Glucose-6-phosphate 1-epimerase n=1 Tax=Coniophora puteana (strain RWD-64-598) TaxID=741705 RepID=A0A5M3MX55_CONPW|nr:galactose mutarotase-like protein [Coniophora puteana RWD-64-598 SS2]EIW83577.1 galactose mutarotase-like protein [Coniophora puteana RWD-64-598 SS2]